MKTKKEPKSETDERGVRYDSAWYPHTINCIRGSASHTNPQKCVCGGHQLLGKED